MFIYESTNKKTASTAVAAAAAIATTIKRQECLMLIQNITSKYHRVTIRAIHWIDSIHTLAFALKFLALTGALYYTHNNNNGSVERPNATE